MFRPPASMCAIAAIAAAASAQVVEVEIRNFTFTPRNISISVGDTVHWTNRDNMEHTATSQTGPGTLIPSGVFDSGLLSFGDQFSFTFTTPGTFNYFCVPHGSSMQGAITVTAPPPPCPGDANADRLVNAADLSVLLAQFTATVPSGSGADFNNDAVVNAADLSVLLSAFGAKCT